jgi:hypothetical protein
MARVPLEPTWEPDDDGWVQPAPPLLPPPGEPTVYEFDDEPAGWLWLPGDEWVEVLPDRAPFGFARHLHGGNMAASVFDELDSLARSKGPACTVRVALEAMSKDVRAQFEAAMDDPGRMGTHIAKVFQNRGYEVREGAVRRHRKGECACGR